MRVVSLTRRLIYPRRKQFPVLIGIEAGDPTGSPESLKTSKIFSLTHSRTKIPGVQLSVPQIAIHRITYLTLQELVFRPLCPLTLILD